MYPNCIQSGFFNSFSVYYLTQVLFGLGIELIIFFFYSNECRSKSGMSLFKKIEINQKSIVH